MVMSYPVPENESARLKALEQYGILDTAPEAFFDDIAKLAAHICGVPMAVVSILAQDRQWFKAKVGLDLDETARELAFCNHAILSSDTLIVADATQDSRFAQHPYVMEEPAIRFYMGAPLTDGDGFALGTLCVIDTQPRMISAEQQEAIERLRGLIVHEMAQRKATYMLAEALKDIKTLSGLLPICANCKSVRHDDGYWKKIEAYMEEHSEARFSHGICPDCVETLYPGMLRKKKPKS